MRAYLCWNCGKLCECQKTFPNGRPQRQSECSEFVHAMPEAGSRITRPEIAETLGCSRRTVVRMISEENGLRRLTSLMKQKGVILTFERRKNKIYFYKEEIKDV